MAEQAHGGDILNGKAEARHAYKSANRRKILFILLFCAVIVGSFFLTLGFGVYHISLFDSWATFINHLTGNIQDADADYYIWDVRTPRAIGALCVGISLAVAGVVMQNNFRNPLADPYTMGISSGAFLGACVYIIAGVTILPLGGLSGGVGNAFLFSLIPAGIIVLVSYFRKMTPTAMILTGIAIMFLFSSICQILMITASSETMASAYEWRVGSLSRMRWDYVPVMIGVSSVLVVVIWFLSDKLNVMYAGDRAAQSLGEKPSLVRILTLVLASLLTASVVAYTGTIGFIGLVGPHVARIFVGSNNRYLIPASAAFGAAFVLLADSLAKVSGINGLPVGVICSMVGGPLFIIILIRQRKSAWA
ncbi:MAG: iron ABC transporter permease [archaeon]|nr:iron ABC transporter permease [archaeon]